MGWGPVSKAAQVFRSDVVQRRISQDQVLPVFRGGLAQEAGRVDFMLFKSCSIRLE